MQIREVLPRDAIPSIDAPTFGPTHFGPDGDQVIAVAGDPARAYPIRILSYHEVVNSDTDGDPIAVTWCPICWSAAVYDRTVDGQVLTFGVSGNLADDALVLYDRETETEWRQPSGEALRGPLAGSRLEMRPAPIVTAGAFRTAHPDGQFLQPVRGGPDATDEALQDLHDMARYEDYVEREAFGLYGMRGTGEPRDWDRTDIDAKTLVAGVETAEAARGYPRPHVEAAGGVVTDTVGALSVVVVAHGDTLHVFEDPGLAFELADAGHLRADGTTWDPVTGASADGRSLVRHPAPTLFAWQDDHGPESLYTGPEN